jgi:2-aminomuconate deaminase
MTAIESNRAPEPVGAYPHARRVGNLLFLSGVGPRRRGSKEIPGVRLDASGRVIGYDIEAQVRSCFDNVRAILEEAGSRWENIVDVLVFLTDMERDFAVYNRLWAEYFPPGPTQPTRTTIQVGALPRGGNAPIAFEVKIVATV